MDYIWSPWRYHYVKQADKESSCVFCEIHASDDDENNLVVLRGQSNFIVLNRYPYTSGHVMIVPTAHVATVEDTSAEVLEEMMRLAQQAESALRKLYKPDGLNIGMNIGKAAGAGIGGHIHLHVLPRWIADNNFVTVVGETRVLPEELPQTWRRLRAEFHPPSS